MSPRFELSIVVCLVAALGGAVDVAAEQNGPVLPPPAIVPDPTDSTESSSESLGDRSIATKPFAWSKLLRELADETIPRDYEVRQGWGRQTRVFTGLRIREQKGLPRISKRTKRVNHGVWRRFRVALHRPGQKLRFAVRDVRTTDRGGVTLKVVLTARVRCTAQSEFWSYGVRTGRATVQADATVRGVVRFVVTGREVEPADDGWLVDVEYAPEVDRVRLELDDFDVRRVGQLDGDLADGLGNSAEWLLAEVLGTQEKKLTRRIQRELRERDARVSLSVPRALWEGARSNAERN